MYREEIYKMLKTLQGEHIFKKKSQEHKLSCARICFFMQETWSLQGFVLVRKEHLEMRMVLSPCAQTPGTRTSCISYFNVVCVHGLFS